MIELYKSYCATCQKQTTQFIARISLKRGIKLKCSSCGSVKKKYEKAGSLTKLERKENEK